MDVGEAVPLVADDKLGERLDDWDLDSLLVPVPEADVDAVGESDRLAEAVGVADSLGDALADLLVDVEDVSEMVEDPDSETVGVTVTPGVEVGLGGTQVVAPLSLTSPAIHVVQDVAPARLNVPAGHKNAWVDRDCGVQ